MKGCLITIEGISGIGKTYFFNKLKEQYKDNKNIIFNGEITDGNYKGYTETLYNVLSSTNSRFFDLGNPKAETLLIAAKQSFDEENIIVPAINSGKIVISDRGYDTICIVEGIMLAKKYPGSAKEYSKMIYKFLQNFNILPQKTIFLDGNIENSIKRAEKRDLKLNYPKYTASEKKILYDCAKLYREYSKDYKNRIEKINIENENAYNEIIKIIEKEINKNERRNKK